MATGSTSCGGSQYQFRDEVPEEFFCKKCSRLCDRLTMTGCCGESFCFECVASCKDAGMSCPACNEENYDIFESEDHQQKLNKFRIFCHFRYEGCAWVGTVDQLDSHLDIMKQDGCQYVKVPCPLGCQEGIPKCKLKEHLVGQCVQRGYARQYHSFSGPYQQTSNMPGYTKMTFKSQNFRTMDGYCCDMDDQNSVCFLQGKVRDHNWTQEKTIWKLTAGKDSETPNMENFQHLLDREKKVKDVSFEHSLQKLYEVIEVQQTQNKALQERLEELQKSIEEQNQEHKNNLEKLEAELKEQRQQKPTENLEMIQTLESTLQEMSCELKELKMHIKNFNKEKDRAIKELRDMIVVSKNFEVEDVTPKRLGTESSEWTTATTYTQFSGYKYCIKMTSREKSVVLHLKVLDGEFDHFLKWPLRASFAMELQDPNGGESLKCITGRRSWKKPFQTSSMHVFYFRPDPSGIYQGFVDNSMLENFIKCDQLTIAVTDITMYTK